MSGTVDSQSNQLMSEIFGSSCEKDSDKTETSNRVHLKYRSSIEKRTHDASVSNRDSSKMLDKSELFQPEHFSCSEQQTFVNSLPLVNADVKKSLTLSNSRCSVGAGSEKIDGCDRHEETSSKPCDVHDSSTALLQQREEPIDLYGDPLHLGDGDNGIEGHSGGSLKDYAIDALVNDHFADPGRKVEQLLSSKNASRFTDKDTSIDLHRDILNDSYRESRIVSAMPMNPIPLPGHHLADDSYMSSTRSLVKSPLPALNLYTEIVCDDMGQRDLSNHEMRSRISETQDYIRFLHEKLDTVESSSEKLVPENTVLKKNMSALLLTSQTELQHKASQVVSPRMKNDPAIVNALAKQRKNGTKENPLPGISNHLSSPMSDASYEYTQLYGESLMSQVLSNTDTDGKSRRMASSGVKYGDSKASRDADKNEIQKKRKYEEDSRGDSKKHKMSPSVSARGRTEKRNVDKYPSSSDPSNRHREKHHTRNDYPGDGTLDSCSRVDKHELDSKTKEEKKVHENDKKGDVKAVKQRNRASNVPLTSLKRKRVTDCDTTTKQSDSAVYLANEVILEGGDHIDEVNHFLISPKKICMQYTSVYSPSSNNNENKALKLSSPAETDEITDYCEGAKCLRTDETTNHGKGAKCLETDEIKGHGNLMDQTTNSEMKDSSDSSSDEESSSSDDTSSDSDSDVGERNSVYPASSGIRNKSQQAVNGSGNSYVFKLFDRLKPLNELFSSMLSSQNRRTKTSKLDVSKVSKTSASNTQIDKTKDSKAKDTTAKIVSDKSYTIDGKDNPVSKVSKTSASNTKSGKGNNSKAKDTTAKIVSYKMFTISDKDNPVSKVLKNSVCNTQTGKAKHSKVKDATAKILSDKSDTISDKDSIDSLQLKVNSDKEISDDNTLEDWELRSESPDDYIGSKRLIEKKPNFEPLIKLKTSKISASTSGQQRGHSRGMKLSMDLYRPMTGESHASNQATKAFSTLKGYKIPQNGSFGSQKRSFSDVSSIDKTPKRKRQSVG